MEEETLNDIDINELVAEALTPEDSSSSLTEEDRNMIEAIVEQEMRYKLNPIPVEESTSRFSSADWFDLMKRQEITIAGLGGIGSYVAFLVARLKPARIYMYDPDTVETVNMSGQLYSSNDVGTSKVFSMTRFMKSYCNFFNYISMHENFTVFSNSTPIFICGFDNMSARKEAFESWERLVASFSEEQKKEALFIDGRLAAEEFQVFCMTGEDLYYRDLYKKEWLFDDYQAEHTLCSYKQTSFCANMIASVMVNLLVNFISNLGDPVIPRELPFKTAYDATLMRLITE